VAYVYLVLHKSGIFVSITNLNILIYCYCHTIPLCGLLFDHCTFNLAAVFVSVVRTKAVIRKWPLLPQKLREEESNEEGNLDNEILDHKSFVSVIS
jgi:hypothetical protein